MRWWLVVLAVACLTHTVQITPQKDDAVVAVGAQMWTSGMDTLSLCEDMAAEATMTEDGCEIAHVVRGGDRTTARSKDVGGGCGGCPLENTLFVTGTLKGMAVTGKIAVGDFYEDDPYKFPYTIELQCTDKTIGCSFSGNLGADGKILSQLGDAAQQWIPAGPATCP